MYDRLPADASPTQVCDAWMLCVKTSPLTLNTLRRALTVILRFAWANSKRFASMEDALKCMTYSDEEGESGLEITAGTSNNPGDTSHVPGIVVSFRDGASFEKFGFSGTAYESDDMSAIVRTQRATAMCLISHRHADADVAGMMSDFSYLLFTALYERLFAVWGESLRDFRVLSQSEPKLQAGPNADPSRYYVSDLVIQISFDIKVRVSRESLRLADSNIHTDISPDFRG